MDPLPILALAFGSTDVFKPEVYVLLADGGNVVVGRNTQVTVDGLAVPRLTADGSDRKLALLSWVTTAPAPVVVAVAGNPPYVVPTSVALASQPPAAP